YPYLAHHDLLSFPTRRSSDLKSLASPHIHPSSPSGCFASESSFFCSSMFVPLSSVSLSSLLPVQPAITKKHTTKTTPNPFFMIQIPPRKLLICNSKLLL